MSISDFSQINAIANFVSTNNLAMVSRQKDFTNISNSTGNNIFIGLDAGNGIKPNQQLAKSIFLGYQASLNENVSATDLIEDSIAIGNDATILKSNDFILGGKSRIAIGNMNPQYALHISNITSESNHICNAVMYLDDISTPIEMTNPPSTGGVFYIENKLPQFASATVRGDIPIIPRQQGNNPYLPYIADLYTGTLQPGDPFASATFNYPQITTDSYIFFSRQNVGGYTNVSNLGELTLANQTNGSFTIQSSNANDNGQVQCMVVNFYNL